MNQASGTEFAAVGLTVTQGLGLWLAFAPSPTDVLRGDITDDEFRIALRHSEAVVGGLTIATGVIGSAILKSPVPLVAALGIMAALVVATEVSLRMQIVDNTNGEHAS